MDIIPSARISDTSAPTVAPVMASAGRTWQTMKRPVLTCQNLRRLVLDAVAQTVADIRTINNDLRAVAFVNRADPIGDDNAEAEAAFAEHAEIIEAAPIRVGNRKSIAVAHLMGLAAVEARRPDAKAITELDALFWYAFNTAEAR